MGRRLGVLIRRPGPLIRERLLRPIPSKLALMRARLNGAPRRAVVFYPGRANPHHVLYRLFHCWGWRTATDPEGGCDLAIAWRNASADDPQPLLRRLAERVAVLNLDCVDVSKARVDAVAAEAFGYDIRIDPRRHRGPCVRKSNENARHDGLVVMGPLEPESGYVYQRLVDNRCGNSLVEDVRLPFFDGSIPFAYRKFRPLADRFSNGNTRVEIAPCAEVLTDDELDRVVALCRSICLEYGELDCLRDRTDGRLYVVDANPTPYGPPNHLPRRDAARAMAMLAEAFRQAFESRVKGGLGPADPA